MGFDPMGKCRLFARPTSSLFPIFPWFPQQGLSLQGFHQVVGGSPDVVSFLLLFWSIVVACVVACLPLAPGVLSFATVCSFGCCIPARMFRVHCDGCFWGTDIFRPSFSCHLCSSLLHPFVRLPLLRLGKQRGDVGCMSYHYYSY